jgi:hypothetical protein
MLAADRGTTRQGKRLGQAATQPDPPFPKHFDAGAERQYLAEPEQNRAWYGAIDDPIRQGLQDILLRSTIQQRDIGVDHSNGITLACDRGHR